MKNNKEYSQKSIEIFRDSIFDSFSKTKDPRILSKSIRHQLCNILFITLCATLCGANNLKEVTAYAVGRKSWLSEILDLSDEIPSYSTFWLFFAMLDPSEFHQGFTNWVSCLSENLKGVYAIDGKALRGTAIKGKANSFVHMVSLWACSEELTLGQVKVKDKSNEITAIPKLLEMIDISDCIITIDAMGTQKKIAEKIIEEDGDYILALKGNQSSLQDEVVNFFEQAEKINFEGVKHQMYQISEDGHGRSEKRTVFATDDIDWLPMKDKWVGLKSIILLNSECTINGKMVKEQHMYISSLEANATRIAHSIRSHWGIESCHWILDVAFQEDKLKARGGHISENLSLIRKMALGMLKKDKKTKGGIELKRKKAGWDPSYLLELIGIKF